MAQCSSDWATYRFHQSTFEQIKQSVKKAKAALQDRSSFLTTSAFRYVELNVSPCHLSIEKIPSYIKIKWFNYICCVNICSTFILVKSTQRLV